MIAQLKDTKRRFHDSVVWEPITKSFPVYDKDTVRTDDYSEVIVKLKDGTEVKLEENSMAIFSLAQDELNINFSNGAIQLENAQKVNLISNENKFLISNGKLTAKKVYTDLVSLKVEEGEVKLNSQGRLEEIEKNSNVRVKQERILTSEKVPFLVSPVSNYFSTNQEKYSILFKWKPVSQNSKYRLEISSAQNRQLVFQKEVTGNQIEITLPVGNYRWKLVPLSKEETPSDPAKFAVVSGKPVQILLPTLSARFVYVHSSPKILFRWVKEEFFTNYRLEISTSSDFSNIFASYNSQSEEVLVENLKVGKYYYRVIANPIFSGMQLKQSLIRDFEIQKTNIPEAIQLVSPENKKSIFLTKKDESQNTFVWKKNKEYAEYEFQIAKNSNFQELIHQELTKEHFLILKKSLPVGVYYWRVVGHFENEKISSEVRSLHIFDTQKITLINPRNQETLEEGKIEFSWKEFPFASSYLLEISYDPNFQKIFKTQMSETSSISLTLRNKGNFYWRVRVPDNKKIFSEVRELSLLPEPKIEISFPKDKEIVDVFPINELKFTWKSNVDVKSYNIEIIKIPENIKILTEKNWKKNEYLIKNLKIFKRSDYEIIITSEYQDKEKIRKLISKSNFTITLSKVSKKEEVFVVNVK
ncbi:MAG: hypothetical protein N3A69_08300 [Leptospiraceae bacterium]|nr:hypothetical protein [Leptospiraceae bacterium]